MVIMMHRDSVQEFLNNKWRGGRKYLRPPIKSKGWMRARALRLNQDRAIFFEIFKSLTRAAHHAFEWIFRS